MTVITFKDHPNETVEKLIAESEVHPIIRWPVQLVWSNSIVLFILSFFLVRHYPINWSLKFFIGDVSIPNVQFNTLTAVITFITVIVLSMSHIKKKVETAKKADLTEHQIEEFQKNEVRESFRSAALLGLGAFFITNQIPSAFELSVFTLEVISLLSPYTLDRLIH